jgi:protein arginine N-methyltransferase 1
LAEISAYTVSGYGQMIKDVGRMGAYAAALRRKVAPGLVVADIGAGTGIFSLLACQYGASRVYAIEPDDAICLARECAAANGYAERIRFFQAVSTRVTLPERVDVVVSDLRGVLPLLQRHLPSIVDARERFLAPGGVLIPQRDVLWTTAVEAAEVYKPYLEPWRTNEYGLDLTAGRRIVTNTWTKANVSPEQFLAPPQPWATLDYTTLTSADITGSVRQTIERQGTIHGLAVWFDTVLAEDVGFSNAPGQPELIYGQAFFPLAEPVAVSAADEVAVRFDAHLVGDDYVWQWSTTVLAQGDPQRVKGEFRQSTVHGVPLSLDRLRTREARHVPALNEDGEIDRLILSLADGATPLRGIAERVAEKFPARFGGWEEALTRVADVAGRYGR